MRLIAACCATLLCLAAAGCEDPNSRMKFPSYEDDIMTDSTGSADDGGGSGLVDFMDPREEQLFTGLPISAGEVALNPENSKIEWAGQPSEADEPPHGGFARFSGTLQVDGSPPALRSVTLEVEVASLWTQPSQLRAELLSADFLDVERYPAVTFQSTGIEQREPGEYTLQGKLSVRGVTKELTLPAAVRFREDGLTFDTEFSIRRADFGMTSGGESIPAQIAVTAIAGQQTELPESESQNGQ